MPNVKPRRDWIVYAVVAAAEVAYLVLTVAAPKNESQNRFHMTPVQMFLLQLTIVVPYLVAWFAGARGALSFRRCGTTVSEQEGARGFRACGYGIAMLVGGSLVSSIVGAVRPFVGEGGAAAVGFTVANNYIYVLTNLLASAFLFKGANRLVGPSDNPAHERDDLVMAAILAVIVGGLYLPLVFTNPTRQVSADASVAASYYLPDAAIVLTVILPYIVAWTLGFLTAMRIARYAPAERGTAQKKAVRRFVNGLWMTLFSSILLQLLVSIGSGRLLSLGIGSILAIIYVFIGLQIAGFLLISAGSKRLCRLEEPVEKLKVTAVPSL